MSIREQFVRDIETDKLLFPSNFKRYTSYSFATLGGTVTIIGMLCDEYQLALLGIAVAGIIACLYGIKAYRYIQRMEDERR